MTVGPVATERVVAVPDLFFSTTDRKGVIDGANTVFCSYAQYAMQELLGAPHNIIRHPDMPAGVFHVMWNLLLSGQPMAGYVSNLAHDGATYWVFATITPLGDGFLSVRQRPCRTDLWETAAALYPRVRAMELDLRTRGGSRAEAARLGAESLAASIGALGFADYADFIRVAVPAEVAARRAQTSWTGPDPRDPGMGVTQDLIDAAAAVDQALDAQLRGLDDLESLSARLAETSDQTELSLRQLRDAVAAAAAASAEVADTEPVLGRIVTPLIEISQLQHEVIADLNRRIDEVRARIAELRLRTALARLHDEMLAEFAREMAAGAAPERAPVYVQQLCRALEEAATTAARERLLTSDRLGTLAEEFGRVEGEMHTFQRQLATWRLLVPRYHLSQRLDPYTAPIDAQLSSGLRLVSAIRTLAAQCQSSARPPDGRPLEDAVAAVVEARIAVERRLT